MKRIILIFTVFLLYFNIYGEQAVEQSINDGELYRNENYGEGGASSNNEQKVTNKKLPQKTTQYENLIEITNEDDNTGIEDKQKRAKAAKNTGELSQAKSYYRFTILDEPQNKKLDLSNERQQALKALKLNFDKTIKNNFLEPKYSKLSKEELKYTFLHNKMLLQKLQTAGKDQQKQILKNLKNDMRKKYIKTLDLLEDEDIANAKKKFDKLWKQNLGKKYKTVVKIFKGRYNYLSEKLLKKHVDPDKLTFKFYTKVPVPVSLNQKKNEKIIRKKLTADAKKEKPQQKGRRGTNKKKKPLTAKQKNNLKLAKNLENYLSEIMDIKYLACKEGKTSIIRDGQEIPLDKLLNYDLKKAAQLFEKLAERDATLLSQVREKKIKNLNRMKSDIEEGLAKIKKKNETRAETSDKDKEKEKGFNNVKDHINTEISLYEPFGPITKSKTYQKDRKRFKELREKHIKFYNNRAKIAQLTDQINYRKSKVKSMQIKSIKYKKDIKSIQQKLKELIKKDDKFDGQSEDSVRLNNQINDKKSKLIYNNKTLKQYKKDMKSIQQRLEKLKIKPPTMSSEEQLELDQLRNKFANHYKKLTKDYKEDFKGRLRGILNDMKKKECLDPDELQKGYKGINEASPKSVRLKELVKDDHTPLLSITDCDKVQDEGPTLGEKIINSILEGSKGTLTLSSKYTNMPDIINALEGTLSPELKPIMNQINKYYTGLNVNMMTAESAFNNEKEALKEYIKNSFKTQESDNSMKAAFKELASRLGRIMLADSGIVKNEKQKERLINDALSGENVTMKAIRDHMLQQVDHAKTPEDLLKLDFNSKNILWQKVGTNSIKKIPQLYVDTKEGTVFENKQ